MNKKFSSIQASSYIIYAKKIQTKQQKCHASENNKDQAMQSLHKS